MTGYPYAYPRAMPYAGMPTGANPYSPSVSREQELDVEVSVKRIG